MMLPALCGVSELPLPHHPLPPSSNQRCRWRKGANKVTLSGAMERCPTREFRSYGKDRTSPHP